MDERASNGEGPVRVLVREEVRCQGGGEEEWLTLAQWDHVADGGRRALLSRCSRKNGRFETKITYLYYNLIIYEVRKTLQSTIDCKKARSLRKQEKCGG